MNRPSKEARAYEKLAQRGVRNALRENALLGFSVPIASGLDGKGVTWITPAEILEEVRKQEEAEKAEELAEAAAA